MKELPSDDEEPYLSTLIKIVIVMGGPHVLTRGVTEGIIDHEEEIKPTWLGRSVTKIARNNAEMIKRGILKAATKSQVGEVHSIASMAKDLRDNSREYYEKTLLIIHNLALTVCQEKKSTP